MKIRDDIFICYGRQNGKYNLSLEQLLEKIKEIQKYNSEPVENTKVQNINLR